MKSSTKESLIFKGLLIMIVCSIHVRTFVEKQSFISELNSVGIWSDPVTAIHDQWNEPAQHYLCGYAVRQMKWTKLCNNCNCGYKSIFKLFNYKCEWCENSFYSMRNAFKTIYCNVNDWTSQVVKIIQTGNAQSKNWKEFKCPKGFYVKQATSRFGVEQQTNLGFTGMQIVCSNLEQTKTHLIDDKPDLLFEDSSNNTPGTFISAVRIKYEKNGKLTGIKWIFEGIPLITKAEIKYGQIVGKSTQKIIETLQLVNNGKQGKKMKVFLTNNYTTNHTWINKNSYFSEYIISNNIEIRPPQLNLDKDEGLYSISRAKFGFDSPVANKYTPKISLSTGSSVVIPVPPSSNFTVSTVIDEMLTTVPYQLKVKFYDKLSGEFISENSFEGIYTGVVESPITMNIEQNQCFGAWGKRNFVVNGDFEQNSCTLAVNWCSYNEISIGGNVPGWIPSPYMEIGRGNLYNPVLGSSWVSELDAEVNTCIKQKLILGPGLYSLSFERTARVDLSLESNQMEVRWSGSVLKKISPENYSTKRESVEVRLSEESKEQWLQFCGGGKSDSRGMVIDNVQMVVWNDCGSVKTIKY